MKVIREIIRSASDSYNINSEVEILVLPFSYNGNSAQDIKQKNISFAGSLKDYANPSLIETEKDIAWEQAAKDESVIFCSVL